MDLYRASIVNIPDNLILEIFSYLSLKELCQIARVCKQWHRITRDNQLWRHVDITSYSLNLKRMWKILRSHFSEVLLTLKLSGYHSPAQKGANVNKKNLSTAMLKDLQERCPNLRTLWLHNCNLEPVNAALLPSSVHTLDFYWSAVPLGWFKPIETGSLKNLKVLKLSRCSRISLTDLEHISKVATLEVLDLGDCYRVTDDALRVVAEKLTCLTELRINGTSCSDLALHHISRNLKNLKLLDVSENYRLSDAAIASVASGLKNLVHLNISGCEVLTDTAVNSVANNLKQLQVFHFYNTNTTCEPVRSFSKKMPKLRDIAMGNIDDEGLESLLQLDLVSLNVGVANLSDEGLSHFLKFKNLKKLILSNCQSERAIQILKGQLPGCVVLTTL